MTKESWVVDTEMSTATVRTSDGEAVARCYRGSVDAYKIAALPDMLEFVLTMARAVTPEDEFADNPRAYSDADEMMADFDDERLCGEYEAFMGMVRAARELVVLLKVRGPST